MKYPLTLNTNNSEYTHYPIFAGLELAIFTQTQSRIENMPDLNLFSCQHQDL